MTPSHIVSVPSCRETTIFEVRARRIGADFTLFALRVARSLRSIRWARVRYACRAHSPSPVGRGPAHCPVLLGFPSADCLRVNACGFDVVGRLLLGGVSALGASAGEHAALGLDTAAVSPDKNKIAMFRAPTLAAAARIHWLVDTRGRPARKPCRAHARGAVVLVSFVSVSVLILTGFDSERAAQLFSSLLVLEPRFVVGDRRGGRDGAAACYYTVRFQIIPDIYLQRFMPNVNPRPLSYRPCGAVQRSADGRVRATSPLAHTKSRSGDSAIM
ncbi:hypothetical protein C8R47DRAFT_1329851 [Mycena vitilis]|nr:hypothetical protein C8R47DRAFT_1329851 [Mycena vitilis]